MGLLHEQFMVTTHSEQASSHQQHNMADYENMTIINLYSSLGYERKSSKERFETLNNAASSFFREYVNKGNEISRKKAKLEGARLCALNFLHEDERGESFWPVSADGTLQWARDCDREA